MSQDEEDLKWIEEKREEGLRKMEAKGIHLNSGIFPDRRASEREWWGYSTALCPCWLMLHCNKTGAEGVVKDPSSKEWTGAYHWPSDPQPWPHNDRVTVMKEGK